MDARRVVVRIVRAAVDVVPSRHILLAVRLDNGHRIHIICIDMEIGGRQDCGLGQLRADEEPTSLQADARMSGRHAPNVQIALALLRQSMDVRRRKRAYLIPITCGDSDLHVVRHVDQGDLDGRASCASTRRKAKGQRHVPHLLVRHVPHLPYRGGSCKTPPSRRLRARPRNLTNLPNASRRG